MTNLLRIKRRTTGLAGAPTSLANAELAYNEVDDTLYYGKGTGGSGGTATSVIPIAGSGYVNSRGFLTTNQAITLSGDATGTGTTGIVVTFPALAGVTAGAYGNLTINTKGQVTGAVALAASHITAALGSAALTVSMLNAVNGVPMLDSGGKISVAQLPAAVLGSVKYTGTWDVSTNTPAVASGGMVGGSAVTTGSYYIVSTGGTLGTAVDGLTVFVAGDWLVFNGTIWEKLDGAANPVSSVNGSQGAVIVNASNLPGAGSMILQAATAVNITGGTMDGVVIGGVTPAAGTFTTLTATTFTLDGGTF